MKSEPNLSKVKKGDMIYSPAYGYCEVTVNFGKTDHQPFGFIYLQNRYSCNHFGREAQYSDHFGPELHPRYFLNLGECVKYYSELYLLTLDKEKTND